MAEKTAKSLSDIFSLLPEYVIEIGVFSEQTKRKEKVQVGLTNAELMFIHEYGSPLHNLPARPVLQMTIAWAKTQIGPTMGRAASAFFKSGEAAYKKELDKFALKMEKYARHIIYDNDGRLAPNAPSTALAKARKAGSNNQADGNHPLFDTGQLARSITCQAVKVR